MVKAKYSLTEGPLFTRILTFAIPIVLTSLLHSAYSMVGGIIVGQYSGDPHALTAIGSTTYLIGLFSNILIGLSTGAGIVIARFCGAGDRDKIRRATHSAMTFSLLVGLVIATVSLILSESILVWLGTTSEAFDGALLYFRLIMIGIPAVAVYNFGNSIMRSAGNSKTPLYILGISGLLNVIFSFVFVALFGMGLRGVAFATVLSQYVSAVWVSIILFRAKGQHYELLAKELKIDRESLVQILLFGIPAALQSSLFALSNLIITNSINSLGNIAMSSMTITEMIVVFPSAIISSFTHSATTVLAQNSGAGHIARTRKTVFYSIFQITVISSVTAILSFILSPTLLHTFMSDTVADREAVYECARSLMSWYSFTFLLLGFMDVLAGLLRGFGKAVTSMLICLPSIILLRVFWIFVIFPLEQFHSLDGIYMCYPISWAFSSALLAAFLVPTFIKNCGRKRLKNENTVAEGVEND